MSTLHCAMKRSWMVAAALVLSTIAASAEIRPLNAGRYQEAAAEPEVPLNLLRLGFDDYRDAPFTAWVRTPYDAVAFAFYEAKRTYSEVVVPPDAVLTAQTVDVPVTPGYSMFKSDSIQSVVIKRRGEILRPLRQVLAPAPYRTAMGGERTFTTGTFTFPMAAFVADEPITIVLIGKTETVEVPVSINVLAGMR